MATNNLYVNAFSAATFNWNTHTGHTPYLDLDPTHSIQAFTDHVVDDSYGFADTSGLYLWAAVTSVKLRGQVSSDNEDHYAVALLSGASGGAWSTSVNIFAVDATSAWRDFTSADLKATINSLARIDECAMKLTKHNIGAGTLGLSDVYLEVTYTVAGGQQTKTLIEEYDY